MRPDTLGGQADGKGPGKTTNGEAPTETITTNRRGTSPWARLCLVLTLALPAGVLSGCATLTVGAVLGSPHAGVPEEVVRYDWAGRRGDEVVDGGDQTWPA